MRRWLLIPQSELKDLEAVASIEIFTSGDGEPMQGDLSAAVIRLAERQRGDVKDGRFDVVLLPLDDAQGMTFELEQAANLLSRGSF